MNQFETRTDRLVDQLYSAMIAWDSGLAQLSHPIQEIAAVHCLPLLRFVAACAKAVSELPVVRNKSIRL